MNRGHRQRWYPPPFDPERRAKLLAHAFEFVAAVMRVDGVRQIALLGSILTDKAQPKDIDLLVTIEPDVDWEELARLGRRLRGRGQATCSGADIFLADGTPSYLGRICHYRECWRRRACQARHCGRQQHLNDDLDVLCLPESILREPPLVLWPRQTVRCPVPADVQALLVDRLKEATKA